MVARVSGKSGGSALLASLGAEIRRERETQNLSQEALAQAAGIDRSHMGRIERGERNVTLLNIVRIGLALQTPPSELLDRAGM
jgi:transcriptional regulator with XRE-family HTH domain